MAAGLFIVLVIAIVVAAFLLGTIVKKGVERIGPSATQVDVKLESAEVWLVAWRLRLTGLFVGNPPGCKTPAAITVGDISVRVRARSLFADKLVVESITVKAPVITFEGGLTANNLKKIEQNLNRYIGSSSTAPDSAAAPSSPAQPERKLQVNDLLITGAKLQINTAFSGGRTITLPIPDIHLTALGAGPAGITAVEVGQRALHAVVNAASAVVAKNASVLGKEGAKKAKSALERAADRLKGLFHQ